MDMTNAHSAQANAERLLDAYARGERDFSAWDLAGADLMGADLRGAILRGTSLRGADLHEANLEGVDVAGADLSGANLHGTVLEDVNFELARLAGSGANWEKETGLPVQHAMGEGG